MLSGTLERHDPASTFARVAVYHTWLPLVFGPAKRWKFKV
jgi:hypothetical protein